MLVVSCELGLVCMPQAQFALNEFLPLCSPTNWPAGSSNCRLIRYLLLVFTTAVTCEDGEIADWRLRGFSGITTVILELFPNLYYLVNTLMENCYVRSISLDSNWLALVGPMRSRYTVYVPHFWLLAMLQVTNVSLASYQKQPLCTRPCFLGQFTGVISYWKAPNWVINIKNI